jgi:GT2 family glycosyltransferase
MSPRVGIVILNYNRLSDTLACVESLQRCNYEDKFCVVVDNSSTDGSGEQLRNALRRNDIQVVETEKNLGFAGGNNFGIRHALTLKPNYILVINNDTLVEPDFLFPLVNALEDDPHAAAVTGTICYYPETDRIWTAGGISKPWKATCEHCLSDEPIQEIPPSGRYPVSFISGCAMLVRSDNLVNADLFDERFFMYFEDAELCARLQRSGRMLLYVPESRIYHKVHHQGDTPLTVYFGVRNRLLYAELTGTGITKYGAKLYIFVTVALKILRWSVVRKDLLRAGWKGVQDYRAGLFYEGRRADL